MNYLKFIIALIAIAASTSVVASSALHFGGNGFRVDMVPVDANATSTNRVTQANCDVRVNRRELVLHWSATAFNHTDYPDLESDVYLAATVTRKVGQLVASPNRSVDQSDIVNDDRDAAVAIGIQGNGKLSVNLEVGIDDANAAAGKHCATVVMTVTAH